MTDAIAAPKKPKAKPADRTPEQQITQLKREKKQLLADIAAIETNYESRPSTLLQFLAAVDLCEYDEATAALIRRLQARLANC